MGETLQGVTNGPVFMWTEKLRTHIHKAMVEGKGTRDLCGADGLTTEAFVAEIASRINQETEVKTKAEQLMALNLSPPKRSDTFSPAPANVDMEAIRAMFEDLDLDGNGSIDFEEFSTGLIRLGVQPSTYYGEKNPDI